MGNRKYQKINKKFIYIPLYLVLLGFSIVWFYSFLTKKDNGKAKEVANNSNLEIDYEYFHCFRDYSGQALGGVYDLMPIEDLQSTLVGQKKDCLSDICNDLKDIINGKAKKEKLVGETYVVNDCFRPISEAILQYHDEMMSKELLVGLFYNEGQKELSSDQKHSLSSFLKPFEKKANEMGVLLIGRASRSGSALSNEDLSKDRVERINNYVRDLMGPDVRLNYKYFGAGRPHLDLDRAYQYQLNDSYRKVKTSGKDENYVKRLNQSVLLILYRRSEDPFGLIGSD